LLGMHRRIAAAFDGRKWLDFLHVRLNLTLRISTGYAGKPLQAGRKCGSTHARESPQV
jgi:hypothetical protein